MINLLTACFFLLLIVAVMLGSAFVCRSVWVMLLIVAVGEAATMMVLDSFPVAFDHWVATAIDSGLMVVITAPLIYRMHVESQRSQAEKSRVLATLQSIPDAVIGVDSHQRIEYINSSAEILTGWTDQSAIGAALSEVLRLKDAGGGDSDLISEGIRTLVSRDGNSLDIELSISSSQRSRNQQDIGQVIAFRDISSREQVRRNLLIINEHQRQLNKLLQISSRSMTLDELLLKALDIVLETKFLSLERKAGIFLTEDDIQLRLSAHCNLENTLVTACGLVGFGQCLCGKAALNRLVTFTPCLNADHETRVDGMVDHGHYHVPLVSADVVIGVLMLYVEHGHQSTEEEMGFLTSVGKTLSALIEQKRAEEKIQDLAYYDQLTKLSNRQRLNDHLELVIAQARRQGSGVAVMLLDLDRFKDVNDGLGHSRGDILLVETARRLKLSVRESDLIARLGGDEFAIVMTGLSPDSVAAGSHATQMASRIREELAQPYTLDGHDFVLTTCIGVAFHPSDSQNASDLLKHADAALQHAKKVGRNSFHAYSEDMNNNLAERLTLEKELRQAIAQEQLRLVYQPRVDLETGLINGVEALIRWPHPEKGMISPATFIPIAEDTGLIIDIGTWVIRTACRQMADWAGSGMHQASMMVSVNVSPLQFRQPNFCETVRAIVSESQVDPSRLELELTEGMLMNNKESVLETLKSLKDTGIHLAIDDFGTGYSSLSYLKKFPVDVLKIDQSFVRDIATDTDDAEIVRAIIAMARALRLKVIAEGVETEEQLDFLKSHRCESYQGYYFSRPIPPDEISAMLANQPAAS